MKKVWIILFVLTCLLWLVGCDPGVYQLDGEELLRNTVKIELVSYENASPKSLRTIGRQKPVFDFSNVTFIALLDDSRMEAVVKDVAEQDLMVFGRVLNEPIGKTLILYQHDGRMIVLFSCVYETEKGGTKYYGQSILFDKDGMFVEYLGDISSTYVEQLESAYFESGT